MTTNANMTTAMHRTFMEPLTGVGYLTVPTDADNDVWVETMNLTHDDFNDMVRQLHEVGWRLADDEDGIPWHVVGHTLDGDEVLLLVADEPIIGEPTMDELAEAFDLLNEAADLIPA